MTKGSIVRNVFGNAHAAPGFSNVLISKSRFVAALPQLANIKGTNATIRPSNRSWHMRRGSGGKKVARRETSGSVIIIKLRAEGAHTSSSAAYASE